MFARADQIEILVKAVLITDRGVLSFLRCLICLAYRDVGRAGLSIKMKVSIWIQAHHVVRQLSAQRTQRKLAV